MLDDLKMIHERDAQDALGLISRQASHIAHSFTIANHTALSAMSADEAGAVIFAGMGGVAASAELVKGWLDLPKPLETIRNYQLPGYAGRNTVCIIASYSGNTAETLAAYVDAKSRGAMVIVVAHGGELLSRAKAEAVPYLELPSTVEPRYATWYTARAVAVICDALGLSAGKAASLQAESKWLQSEIAGSQPDVPAIRNQAKLTALELVGKSVVVYAGPALGPLAYKWKIAINENSRQIAWCNQYPEFNHNEFAGWSRQPVAKPYAVVELRGDCERPEIHRRFEVSGRLLSGLRPSPLTVDARGRGLLQQTLYLSVLGDFVSVYLALLNGINPTPNPLVESLKKELS